MSPKKLYLSKIRRTSASGVSDHIDLEPGVNVIVGEKGTGKTAWIKTISFLLGDTNSVEHAMMPEIIEKFDQATMQLEFDEVPFIIERRWKEAGVKTSMFADGEQIRKEEISDFFSLKLDIPSVRFPKGNPLSLSTWATLSWRSLFRHVYRQERFWRDLADEQPEKEQHACIAQFLGVADRIYPAEFNAEMEKHADLLKLKARKDQFEDVLQQAAKDIVPDPSISTAPTIDSIDRGINRLAEEIEQFRTQREKAIATLFREPEGEAPVAPDRVLAERRLSLAGQRDGKKERLDQVEKRYSELSSYREQVKAELGRFKRASTAGELFKPLTVTCCPYCDQSLSPGAAAPGHCFVCHQSMAAPAADALTGANKRIEFETEQLEGEESELAELIGRLMRERESLSGNIQQLDTQLAEVEVQLRPVRAAAVALILPEVSILDTKIGQWEEKTAQLRRLRHAVERRDTISTQIDQLQAEVEALARLVGGKGDAIEYARLADEMTDGLIEYMNLLNEGNPSRWLHQPLRFEFSHSSVNIRVGNKSWRSLSNADQGYVLLAYHYALLKLTGSEGFNYPGLAMIDFPMNFGDKTTVADKENFLIEPFVTLSKAKPNIQVIVGGRSFANLQDVNRIELHEVWRQGVGSNGRPSDTEAPL
ncbi:AAA family ATPase [Tundrisphaera lichenicola]|uniref:AAA family ATPase n=1 Tax=Tundrisphaera lichenicola TaxID=2029860 RepID=UPI003EBD060F